MSDAPGAIARRWAALRAAGRTALIPYLTAGFPSREATVDALRMVEDEGADLVEVGVPFSDPLADGPTIQRSSYEALRRGMTVTGVLEVIAEAGLSIPVVAFTYLNPVLRYGLARFAADARAAGCSGLLLTDLPVGADPDLEAAVAGSGLDRIPLVSLTTAPERLRMTAAGGSGFVYLISRLGVTGAATAIGEGLAEAVTRLRAATTLPIAIGFGIRSGAQAAEAARLGDGVVIGSALVERLGDGLEPARALMRELRQALETTAEVR